MKNLNFCEYSKKKYFGGGGGGGGGSLGGVRVDAGVDSRIFSKAGQLPHQTLKRGPRFSENGEPHEFTEMQHIFYKVYIIT